VAKLGYIPTGPLPTKPLNSTVADKRILHPKRDVAGGGLTIRMENPMNAEVKLSVGIQAYGIMTWLGASAAPVDMSGTHVIVCYLSKRAIFTPL